MTTLKYTMLFSVASLFAMAMNVNAGESTAANPYFVVLSGTTAAELPAKAAELVSKADSKQLQQTTIEVVGAAVPLNPAAAPAIVGSIAQTVPAMAAVAAGTALNLVPDQAAAIAHAAAVAAPSEAGKIVTAMCLVVPKDYQQIANAVAEVVPGADKEILTAVSTAIPSLKDSINNVIAGYNGSIPSVSSVLNQVKSSQDVVTATQLPQATFSSPSLSGPTFGGYYIAPSGSHHNIDPTSGTPVPTGGRNYSSP